MRIKIVVVLFEKKLHESLSLSSLLKQENLSCLNIDLNIYDNSPDACLSDDDIQELSKKYLVSYKHTPENIPLSRIYGEEFSHYQDADYILLLDDDSKLPENYLCFFYSQQKSKGREAVYVPKISVHNKLLSPYRSYFVFSNPIEYSFSGANNRLTAINSGVFVPLSYEQTLFKYPKYCQFYGTDSVLFEYFHKKSIDIYVLDAYIEHDLSFHPNSDEKTYLKSLNNVIRFWRAHYKKTVFWNVLLKVYMLFLSVKLSIKFRKIINLFKKAP